MGSRAGLGGADRCAEAGGGLRHRGQSLAHHGTVVYLVKPVALWPFDLGQSRRYEQEQGSARGPPQEPSL